MAMKKQVKVPTFNQYDTVSPATKLLQKRRKMYQIHQAYQAQKQQFKQKEVVYSEQQQKIKAKDKQFQQDMTKFCQFSQQNQIKKKKAEERLRQEQKIYAQKQQALKSLQKQIKELEISQNRYKNKVNHFKKYQQYLQRVRNSYIDQYPQMIDILNRYNTLKKSNKDLIQKRIQMQTQYQNLKKKSLIQQKQLNRQILTQSNKIKILSRQIQQKLKQKGQIQTAVQSSNQDFNQKNLTLGKIFMAIDNLFFRCHQNTYKLKHDFQDKTNDKKQFKITKKIQGQNNTNINKNQDQVSYQQKSKIAVGKLKDIVQHMKTLKYIIDRFKIAKDQK